jgi:predicted AlkP superfamily phosphohydrolase/phosphomutase
MIAASLLLFAACSDPAPPPAVPPAAPAVATGLHWFIPDGLRADPEVFDLFRWAEEGKLPHLKALIDRGASGYSIPAFPSHTPANFATLLTGATPRVHGVGDGPMRVEGRPLVMPSLGGFSSAARKSPAVWSLLEAAGKRVFLLSVPGSTPPELGAGGVTVRGRWGGWGADFPPVIFEPDSAERKAAMARSARLFLVGEALTRFIAAAPSAGWASAPASEQPPLELDLTHAGAPLHGLLIDPVGDGRAGYDRLLVSQDRATVLATLGAGDWSDWFPATARWKEMDVATSARVEVIKLGPDDFFRVRVLFDGLNRLSTEPPEVAAELRASLGPMVDFPDSFPAQLVHYPEDKAAFAEEARQSLDWHVGAVDAVYRGYRPEVFVHCVYTPNQMLTSRWWMGALDPKSVHYAAMSVAERGTLRDEVIGMYQRIDEAIGRAVAAAGPDALVVLSSDHGAIPLNHYVRVNNLFAERGWLSTTPNPETGAPEVDWAHSTVVFLNTYNVFINPEGLGGDWKRASGPGYEALRSEVITALEGLRNGDERPVARVTPWEEVEADLGLMPSRVGDLVLTSEAGYAWNEELTPDRALFTTPLIAGYKQAVDPNSTPGLWTPFIVAGPGVTPGYRIPKPIRAIDQLPTLLQALGQPIPAQVEGKVVEGVLLDR